MVKSFALPVLAIMLLISMPFAESYSRSYVSDGWLQVTRTLDVGTSGDCPLSQAGISDVCSNSGARQAGSSGSVFTLVTLSLKNIGPMDRAYVNIGESLSYVPSGAAVSFSPSPLRFDGRQAVWEIPSLLRGETVNVTYEFGASVTEAAVGRIPDAAAVAAPSTAMLYAPSKVPINSTLTISLKSLGGSPIAGAKIVVDYPDGSRQSLRTDSSGTVSMVATRTGSYTYSAEGYRLQQLVSTVAYDKAAEDAKAPATAASAADAGILPAILGALPILAIIFAAAVVALIAYNFISARREEEDSTGPAPQLAEQQAKSEPGMNYSQKFSFSREAEHEKSMDDVTRGMVESRKRRMQESEPAPPVEQEEAEARPDTEAPQEEHEEETFTPQRDAADPYPSERTVAGGDMDDELAELERNARIAGEVAEQEKEVENMLAQLESIRNKLRAGRGEGPDEEAPRQPQPPARAAPAKKAAAKPQVKQKPRRK